MSNAGVAYLYRGGLNSIFMDGSLPTIPDDNTIIPGVVNNDEPEDHSDSERSSLDVSSPASFVYTENVQSDGNSTHSNGPVISTVPGHAGVQLGPRPVIAIAGDDSERINSSSATQVEENVGTTSADNLSAISGDRSPRSDIAVVNITDVRITSSDLIGLSFGGGDSADDININVDVGGIDELAQAKTTELPNNAFQYEILYLSELALIGAVSSLLIYGVV